MEEGTLAYQAGRHADAELHYRNALESDPEHAEALFHLGVACHAQQRLEDAFRYCHHALDLDSGRPQWRSSVMHISNDLGKVEGVSHWRARVAATPDFTTWLGLGNALREAGDLAEAEAAYGRARALRPDSPFGARRYGSLLAILGRNEEADTLFRQSGAAGLWPDGVMHMSEAFFAGLEQNRELLLASIPDMAGDWGEANARRVVFLSGDPVYMRKFAYALINSICQNGRLDCLFHLHIVNPNAGIHDHITGLQQELGVKIALTWELRTLPDEDSARTYYACARFLQLPKLLDAYRCPVLLLDLDQLVVGDLGRVGQAVQDADVGLICWHPTRWDPWDTWWASAIWYQPTDLARQFAQWKALYIAECLRNNRSQWYLDQCAIFCVLAWLRSRHGAPAVVRLDATWACLAGGQGDSEVAPGVIFWAVIHSLVENRKVLQGALFGKYTQSPKA